jgi:signal peptidase I
MYKNRTIYFLNISYELGKWALAIIILATACHYFLFTIFSISGPSMEPEFHDGQIVLVSRIGLFTGQYHRGDPMVLKFPGDPQHKKYIKRLVGLPGDTIQIADNRVYVDGKELVETYVRPVDAEFAPYYYDVESWQQEADALHEQGRVLVKPDLVKKLGADEYFLMGDNRENSNDSRKWYAASRSDLIGPVRFILGQLKTNPECFSVCLPKFTLTDWGPVLNPSYGE